MPKLKQPKKHLQLDEARKATVNHAQLSSSGHCASVSASPTARDLSFSPSSFPSSGTTTKKVSCTKPAALLEKPREQKNHHASLMDHRRRTMEKNSLKNINAATPWLTFPTDSEDVLPQVVQEQQPSMSINQSEDDWMCGVGLDQDSTWPSSSASDSTWPSSSASDDFDLLVTSRHHQAIIDNTDANAKEKSSPVDTPLNTTFENVERYFSLPTTSMYNSFPEPEVGDTWKAVIAPAGTRDLAPTLDAEFVECWQLKTMPSIENQVMDIRASRIMKVPKSAPDLKALAEEELYETGACSKRLYTVATNHDFKKPRRARSKPAVLASEWQFSHSNNVVKPLVVTPDCAFLGRSLTRSPPPLPKPKGQDVDKDWKDDIGNCDSNEITKQMLKPTDSPPASKSNRSHSGNKVQERKSTITSPYPQVRSSLPVSMESEKGYFSERSKSHSIPFHHHVKHQGGFSSGAKPSHAPWSNSETKRLEPVSKLFKAPTCTDTNVMFSVIDLREEIKSGLAARKEMSCNASSGLESKERTQCAKPVHENVAVANEAPKDPMLGRDPKFSSYTTGKSSIPASDKESAKSSRDQLFSSQTSAHGSITAPSNRDTKSKALVGEQGLSTTDTKAKAMDHVVPSEHVDTLVTSMENPRSRSQNNVGQKTMLFRDATAEFGKATSGPEPEQPSSRLDGEAKYVNSDDSVVASSSFDLNLVPPTATGILSKTAKILEARKSNTVVKSTRDSNRSHSSSRGEEWEASLNLLVADCSTTDDWSAWYSNECMISSDAAGFLNSHSVSRIGHLGLDESQHILVKKDTSAVVENTLSTDSAVFIDEEARQPCKSNSLEANSEPSRGKSKELLNCHTLISEPRTAMMIPVREQSYSIAVEDWTLEDTVDTVDTVAVAEARPINVVQVSRQEISELYDSASIFGSIDSQSSFRIVPKARAGYSCRNAATNRGTIQRIKPIVSRRAQGKHRCRLPQEKMVQAYSWDDSFVDEQERPPPSLLCHSMKTCFGEERGMEGKREQNRQRALDSIRKKAAKGLFKAALACYTPDLQETSFLTASTGQSSLSTQSPAWDSLFEQYLDFVESSFLNERKTENPQSKPEHIMHGNDTTMVSSAMEVSQRSYLIELNSIAEESPEVEITLDSGTVPALEVRA